MSKLLTLKSIRGSLSQVSDPAGRQNHSRCNNIYRFIIPLLTVIFAFTLRVPAEAAANPTAEPAVLKVEARSAILMDAQSGRILYQLNPDVRWYPASMTKLMTLILAFDAIAEGRVGPEDKVVASEYACSFGGTQVWLEPGEEFTLEELLKAISVGSANDASVAVAEHLAGSEEAFAAEMNRKARELGCTNTNFTNSHGLPHDNHMTSARDLAIMARYALRHPELLKLTSIKEYTFREEPRLVLYNTNKLLWWYPGTDGLKTGTTSQAGRNLVATAVKDNLRLVSVVMGVDKKNGHFSESMKVLNYGFAGYGYKRFHQAGDVVARLRVSKGAKDEVPVVTASQVGSIVAKGRDKGEALESRLFLPPEVAAPVTRGQEIGQAVVLDGGQEVARVALLAAEDVGRGTFTRIFGKAVRSLFLDGPA